MAPIEDIVRELRSQWLRAAYRVAVKSPDQSTQNGAAIFDGNGDAISQGCNTLPWGVELNLARLARPAKYAYTEHAERNAIYAAARMGKSLDGATMACCWAACADCARAIIQSGIKRLIRHAPTLAMSPGHWKESIAIADIMLAEAEVEVIDFDEPIWYAKPIRFNGEMWDPSKARETVTP